MTAKLALDTFLSVTFSDDKSVAYIQFSKREEGFKCTEDELMLFLRSQQIQYGIERDIISRIASHPEEYMFNRTPVAMGVQPVSGKDGYIEYAFKLRDEREQKPLETEDGKVDYKELISLNNVIKGQLIAKKIPPQPGKPGTSVTGEIIAFKPGKEAYFKVGKNVVLDAEQAAMYAAIDGLIATTDKGKINVFPVYEVNGDVDYSIGNIDFVGTVVIRGNILTGFRVKAAGDIRVVGGVEGAELDADGSIEITSGIIGYNKGYVKAGRNVKSSFIQDGNVIAGEDVIVSQSIMHSNIRAGKNVICNGTKGLIVGGSIQAGERVTARTIGNSMSTMTSIEVGVQPELRNELNELRVQTKQLKDALDKTEKALHLLNQLASTGQLTPDKVALRVKLNATQKSTQREQIAARERILEIEKTLEDTVKARVDIIKMIYGGSKIVIGRYTRFIKDPAERVSLYYHEGDISMVPYI
ncbi:FapA family protein [Paenibacillus dokdonensis]|uniref:FapA family protein n=1 Tax=Paenibacillus dokdonensis TaxID=2567944 RepID=A0ABU6GP84_9BACL|nr:FapA family protein [Paenibacillus dokdonensis]MEC0240505.1 FapA family protein [Paenibacillus dokdonensis]